MRAPSAGLRVRWLGALPSRHLEDAPRLRWHAERFPGGSAGVVTAPHGCLILHVCTVYVVGWERTNSLVLVFKDPRTMAIILLFWQGVTSVWGSSET